MMRKEIQNVMPVESLKNEFERFVSSFFSTCGFERIKSERISFSKKSHGDEFRIDFQVIKRLNRYEILPELFISQKEIRRIYSECTTNPFSKKWTLYGRLLLIDSFFHDSETDYQKKNSKWQLKNEENLNTLLRTIPVYYDETILKFFEKNSIEQIDKELNEFPRKDSVMNGIYPIRGNVGLIAGKIVEREHLIELYNIYNERIHLSPEDYQLEREKVWSYLQQRF